MLFNLQESLGAAQALLASNWTAVTMREKLVMMLGASSAAISVLGQNAPYSQCGGTGWTGVSTCQPGWSCKDQNADYSQCLLVASSAPASSIVLSSTSTVPTSTAIPSSPASAPTTPPSKAVGKLPALGWNHWNAYGCNISADKVVAAAQAFVSLGLKDAGYEYVNIDDCWAEMSRDASGKLVPDSTKFPDGIKGVADQVHALGLKIGIYSDAGTNTCAGYPGSLGYENTDAATWDSWGVDYLKYDNCNVPANWTDSSTPPDDDWYDSNSAIRYRQMGGAIATSSRPVQFDLCIWGTANVWEWGARVGHSWRMSYDSSATWSYITEIMSINAQHLDSIDFWSHNDMDMMEIGNGNLTLEEQRTHFAVWAFMKSPILLGTNLFDLDPIQVSIITNPELLAFSQDDTIGTPAHPFTASGTPATDPPQFYSGKSAKGTHIFIVNTRTNETSFTINFADIPQLSGGASFKVHDMWTGTDNGTFSGNWTVSLASHDTAAVLLTSV